MSLPTISAEELRFVEEYVKDRNGTRAVLASGLSSNYFAAAVKSNSLLKNANIKVWIKHVFNIQAKRLRTTIPDLLREFAILGKSDLDDYTVDADGRVDVRPGVPRSALRAVKKVRHNRTETLKGKGDTQSLVVETKVDIELHDKNAPLKALYEHFHGVLPGDSKSAGIDVMGRLTAILSGRFPESGGGAIVAGPDAAINAVDPKAAASPGVPESGG